MKKVAITTAVAALIAARAFAADMPVKAPPPAPVPVYNWTGFYTGLNAGWSWGKQDTTVNFPGPAPGFTLVVPGVPNPGVIPPNEQFPAPLAFQETTHPIGAIGGVQGGYNWQAASNWILGIEADFQASGESATGTTHQNAPSVLFTAFTVPPPPITVFTVNSSQSFSHNDSLLWFGTVPRRLRYLADPHVVWHGRIGLWPTQRVSFRFV
jgi:outer membrane immunogenic protein